jgi:hypothetical protein
MKDDETKKTTVEETPGEKKTTEETHKPGQPAREETRTTRQPGTPDRDEKTTKIERK